jgi:predicted RNA-binding protein with PIN domain
MNIIIDGYNLVKQVIRKTTITQKERMWFLNKAAEYAHRRHHTLIIVYDAGPVERTTTEKNGPVLVVYSGTRLTADDVIKTYIEEKSFHDMLIVTTDRQLNSFAVNHDVPTIDSLDFYQFMKSPQPIKMKKGSQELQKLHPGEGSRELDLLMEEGSRMVPYKEETVKEFPVQKTSKKEKRMFDIIRKL